MPRCRKILANGKRCKAHAIAGSKFCLFHTPGQKMKRTKKSSKQSVPDSKNVLRRSTENQLAVRGSKKLANVTAAYGAYLQTRPESYIYEKQFSARYNKQGRVIVGAHTQRTVMHYRSEGGRNFRATDGSSKGRMAMGRRIVWGGRLIPVLGYGFVLYNTFSGEQDPTMSRDEEMLGRTYQGGTLMAATQVASHFASGGTTINFLTAGRYL